MNLTKLAQEPATPFWKNMGPIGWGLTGAAGGGLLGLGAGLLTREKKRKAISDALMGALVGGGLGAAGGLYFGPKSEEAPPGDKDKTKTDTTPPPPKATSDDKAGPISNRLSQFSDWASQQPQNIQDAIVQNKKLLAGSMGASVGGSAGVAESRKMLANIAAKKQLAASMPSRFRMMGGEKEYIDTIDKLLKQRRDSHMVYPGLSAQDYRDVIKQVKDTASPETTLRRATTAGLTKKSPWYARVFGDAPKYHSTKVPSPKAFRWGTAGRRGAGLAALASIIYSLLPESK